MRWEEKRFRKPIEVWTQMASAVAGSLEDTISSAFSQVMRFFLLCKMLDGFFLKKNTLFDDVIC